MDEWVCPSDAVVTAPALCLMYVTRMTCVTPLLRYTMHFNNIRGFIARNDTGRRKWMNGCAHQTQ